MQAEITLCKPSPEFVCTRFNRGGYYIYCYIKKLHFTQHCLLMCLVLFVTADTGYVLEHTQLVVL
jgi:hypothetical protein